MAPVTRPTSSWPSVSAVRRLATVRPARMTCTWSERRRTCSKLWLISRMVTPLDLRSMISSSTRAVSCTPSAAEGSSSTISLEEKPAARAIDTAWRWPPLRRRTRALTRGTLIASLLTISSASRRIRRRSRRPPRVSSRPRKRFCATVRSSTRARSWNTVSIPADRACCGLVKCTGAPSSRTSPPSGTCTPTRHLTSVDLPAPLSPMMAVSWPRGTDMLALRSACTRPKLLRTSRTVSMSLGAKLSGVEFVISGTS